MAFITEAYIMSMLVTLSIPINLFLVFTLVLKKKLKEPQFFLYTILSFWNILEIAVVMIPNITTWVSGKWIYSEGLCNIRVLFYILCFYIIYITMLLIIVDRYICIKEPLHFNNHTALIRIKISLLFFIGVAVFMSPLITFLLTGNNLKAPVLAQVCTPKFETEFCNKAHGIGLMMFVTIPIPLECHIAYQTFKVVIYHMKKDAFKPCYRNHRQTLFQLFRCRHYSVIKAASIIFILTISNSIILLPYSFYTGLSHVIAFRIEERLYNSFVILMLSNVALNPLVCTIINSRLRKIISSIARIAPKNDVSVTSSAVTRTFKRKPVGQSWAQQPMSNSDTIIVNYAAQMG